MKKGKTHIDIDLYRRIPKMQHAAMPLRLFEHLFRTACDWAIRGDIEAA